MVEAGIMVGGESLFKTPTTLFYQPGSNTLYGIITMKK
jgi:hypothetical protein